MTATNIDAWEDLLDLVKTLPPPSLLQSLSPSTQIRTGENLGGYGFQFCLLCVSIYHFCRRRSSTTAKPSWNSVLHRVGSCLLRLGSLTLREDNKSPGNIAPRLRSDGSSAPL
ncbi:hypothetical protein L484_013211 [Morus notabilis]|uniref:Uncharacterized protein n=1 Tax=Morus notabilis TaxID=981085 RepID=W9REL8_9ROSA|nr:hypothetical protein L484_013211 [Morus notabilis]